MSLLIFIAILVALIWVHELGHFAAAKFFGIRVDEFSIGFPPRLLKVRYGETLYSFNLLLVGGYVKIYGEDAQQGAHDPRSMAHKPRPVQAAVIVAGIVMNLLFGWLILSAGYVAGMPVEVTEQNAARVSNPTVAIINVAPDSPANRAGLLPNDKLERLTAGNDTLEPTIGSHGQAVQEFITAHQDQEITFTLDRQGEEVVVAMTPEAGLVEGRKVVGISMADTGVLKLPVHEALVEGASTAVNMTVLTAQGLVKFFSNLFMGTANFSDVAGPVGIAGVGSQAVQSGYATTIIITALISINLALMNLLPIPGLDGGRLLIIGIESVIRRPVSPRLTMGLTLAGFALIITLMVLVTYHDIAKLVG